MTKTPNPEEAVERARRAQEDRLKSIRDVAEARQSLTTTQEETDRELANLQQQIKERVSAAEAVDISAYNAATRAGWSVDELRKIGFSEPAKKARSRRRTPHKMTKKEAHLPGSQRNEGAPESDSSEATPAQIHKQHLAEE